MSERFTADLTHDARRLRIVIDAGKGNVIDTALAGELKDVLAAHQERRSLRAVTLAATGRHFSFGASVPEHAPEQAAAMITALHGLIIELVTYPVPVLAAVRGCCLGGGLELVLPADRIFVHPEAKLGLPEVTLGMFAPAGSALLGERVSHGIAREILLSGTLFSAQRAVMTGLADDVADDPEAAMERWFEEQLLGLSSSGIRFARQAARAASTPRILRTLMELEKVFLDDLITSQDAQEGVRSFLEKRKPQWADVTQRSGMTEVAS